MPELDSSSTEGDYVPRSKQLDPSILQAALTGLDEQRKRIDEQIANVRSLLGKRGPGRPPASPKEDSGAPPVKKSAAPARKRKLSAAGRQAIIEATKKRWAAFRAAKEGSAKAPKPARKKAAAKKA
jgi:hypothetical protein